ncbi:MAG: helix-turn-helix domain-containing protein, partial [Acidobacteria bacterium]|nr:helix-turn-helix domain-containing protein [Acidobacteriota bacterium]
PASTAARDSGSESLSGMEEEHIRRVLEATHGNKTRAAEILGIQRKTLYRKLERMRGESAFPDCHTVSSLADSNNPFNFIILWKSAVWPSGCFRKGGSKQTMATWRADRED